MKTLLLISPPVLHGQGWWANRIANKPHLASLAGHVRDLAVVETLELDLVAGEALAGLLASVDKAFADAEDIGLVGISCWTSLHYLGAVAVARRVRELAPDTPIVVGGHHATAVPEDFEHSTCDWLVRGDGEHALRRLLREWPARPASEAMALRMEKSARPSAYLDGAGPMAGWLSCQTFFILPGTRAWLQRERNAELYGTEIACPGWWRREADHDALATAVLPSRAWRGREAELHAFRPWNQSINAAWSARYPGEVLAFRTRFYTG